MLPSKVIDYANAFYTFRHGNLFGVVARVLYIALMYYVKMTLNEYGDSILVRVPCHNDITRYTNMFLQVDVTENSQYRRLICHEPAKPVLTS